MANGDMVIVGNFPRIQAVSLNEAVDVAITSPVATTTPTNGDVGIVVRPMPGTEVHALNQELVTQLHGMIHGKTATIWHIMGARSQGWSSTSVLGDVAEYLDTSQPRLNDVSTGTTYYIRSSSASDDGDPVGTGARTVRIFYLDTLGDAQRVTVTLNGTTPVSLGSGFSYFLWMEVATVGSSSTSVGNLTISSNAAGAPAVSEIVEYIAAGGNRSLSGRVKIPTGYTGYLIDWSAMAIGNTMDTRLRGDYFSDDHTSSPGVFHFLDRAFLASGANATMDLHYEYAPAGSEIKVSAIPGGAPAGNKIDVHFDLLLIAN